MSKNPGLKIACFIFGLIFELFLIAVDARTILEIRHFEKAALPNEPRVSGRLRK